MKVTARPLIFVFLWLLLFSFVSTQIEAQDVSWGTVSRYDIVATANRTDDLSTFAAALKTAGLEDVMRQQNSYTVFVPTDAAFGKLPQGTVEDLLKPENRDQLVALLNHHVVINRRIICDCMNGVHELKTVNADTLSVWYSPDRVRVGNAIIVRPDITTKNGMIHVIDTVLLP